MTLVWTRADASRDAADFESFNCWNGNAGVPWVEEVENYVRWWVLDDAQYVVAGRDDGGRLAAVAAFDERVIAVPLVAPIDHPGWHLQVVAIRLDLQASRLFDEVIETTFRIMRSIDPERILVTARVHGANRESLRACARHDLDPFVGLNDDYVDLLGEVPPA